MDAQSPLLLSLQENLSNIRKMMDNSTDLMINELQISGINSALLCCEGLVSTQVMTNLLLLPLMRIDLPKTTPEGLLAHIENDLILALDRPHVEDYALLLRLIMSGFVVLLIEGGAVGLAFGFQGYDRRSVSEPSAEGNIKGSHEGFVETIRVNIAMVRRKVKSQTLKFELFQMGSKSQTDVALCYFTDKVPPQIVVEIKRKLAAIKLETILASGYVQPFLEEKGSFFENIGTTERADVLCGKMLEGRVALLIDGTPFALIIPYLFVENFQTLDDYNSKPYYATIIRWVKYIAFILSLLLPGVYIAIATFHPEMLNDRLLIILAKAESNAPLPLACEAIIMLLLYEILREAGLRLPKALGGAASLVGGLIIGDAAVSSGLVSMPLLLVVALSVTAAFVIPSLNQPLTLLRLGFVIVGGVGGLYGIALLLAVVLINLCSMEDFGIPATAPLSPFSLKSMRDVLTRVGFRKLQSGDFKIDN